MSETTANAAKFARTSNVRRGGRYEVGRGLVACLDCARARKQGKPWGCLVHVAEVL